MPAMAGGRLARMYARTVTALRFPIIAAWLVALVAALVYLPGLGGSGSGAMGDLVPEDARGIRAQEHELRLFGSTLATDTAVVERAERGLTAGEAAARV